MPSRTNPPVSDSLSPAGKQLEFNPWPYSILGFFALLIVAVVVWVGFCIRHGTDLVAADYYEQEIEYQDQLDRIERVRELSGKARVSYESADGFIRIQVPPEHAVLRPPGMIHLYRPSQASLDQTVPLEVTQGGEQRIDASPLSTGVWDVRVQWTVAGKEFFLNQKVYIVRNGT